VLVVDGGGRTDIALWGEIMAVAALERGVAGLVVDGVVRDAGGLRTHAFPVFARGTTPRGPVKSTPGELQVTVARVNDLINDANRANVSQSLSNVRGMLEENRPKLKATMSNVEATSAKMPALVDDFKKTVKDADQAITKIDEMLGENRPDIRASIAELRKTLASASELVEQMGRTVNYNSENIDETLENIRVTTGNLKQFTDTIKSRPYTLIRATPTPERKPGEPPKQ